MSYQGPESFRTAVKELAKLPGVGEKTAQRLAMFLVKSEARYAQALAQSILELKTRNVLCPECYSLSDDGLCTICRSVSRDRGVLCVVEDPSDLLAIEHSGYFKGVYHVLHGSLAPRRGIGPEQLKIEPLMRRATNGVTQEVILATNPDVEGEATALYLAKLFSQRKVRTTRIAMGIPMGGHLEYADQVTLGRAIEERREFHSR